MLIQPDRNRITRVKALGFQPIYGSLPVLVHLWESRLLQNTRWKKSFQKLTPTTSKTNAWAILEVIIAAACPNHPKIFNLCVCISIQFTHTLSFMLKNSYKIQQVGFCSFSSFSKWFKPVVKRTINRFNAIKDLVLMEQLQHRNLHAQRARKKPCRTSWML